MPVRAFYLDITAWALEDPLWVPWAVPCPVRRSDTKGYMKNQRRVQSRMHQRVRDRLPHLLRLVDSAEAHLRTQAELLAAARSAEPGATFDHARTKYRRLPRNGQTRTPVGDSFAVDGAPNLGTASSDSDIVRATPDGKGYHAIDQQGDIASFGDAAKFNTLSKDPSVSTRGAAARPAS